MLPMFYIAVTFANILKGVNFIILHTVERIGVITQSLTFSRAAGGGEC